ncbi:MAG: hypothetical protein KIT58_02970 [Planctomycetota bacterium]|nr:hypothetical protein [Planctomycetota bacterium]
MIEVARVQGEITHTDPRCSVGGRRHRRRRGPGARRTGPVDPAAFLRPARRLAGEVTLTVAGARPAGWPCRPTSRRADQARAGRTFDDGWPGISPLVIGSVGGASDAFLRVPDDPGAKGAWRRPGGDVDTTAAMTGRSPAIALRLGALLAALHGAHH